MVNRNTIYDMKSTRYVDIFKAFDYIDSKMKLT